MLVAKPSRQAAYNDKRVSTNLASLVEPIVRHKILDSLFYKQYLYLTNELTILPIITHHLKYLAGTDSLGRPSPFLCCLLRLLELEPSEEIVMLCLEQQQFKYLSVLMLVYIRFAWTSKSQARVYQVLESYYPDYRKIRTQLKYPVDVDGKQVRFAISYIDEIVHTLLSQERAFDIIMPRLKSREVLEEAGELAARKRDTEEDRSDNSTSDSDGDYESDSD